MGNIDFNDDRKLVDACVAGNVSAWETFVGKYSSLISIAIRNRLKGYVGGVSAGEIDDIRQLVLTGIWEGKTLECVRDRSNISHWLAIVAGNVAAGYMRRKYRRQRPEDTVGDMDLFPDGVGIDGAPGEAKPRDEAARAEVAEKIDEAFETLSDTEKLVVKLSILYGKKQYEISDMLTIPIGTVASHIRRGKEKLRKRLKDLRGK